MVESKLQVVASGAKSRDLSSRAKEPSLEDMIRNCVGVLLHVCRLYGFDDAGYSPRGSCDWYRTMCEKYYSGDWLKLFKDKLASFFAFYIAEFDGSKPELPKVKAPEEVFCSSVLLGGRCYRWVRRLRRRSPLDWRSFITSVLYSKKGFPRPGKKYLKAGEKSTFDTLTTLVPEGLPELVAQPWGEEQLQGPGPPPFVLNWSDDSRINNPYLPLTFSQLEFRSYVKRVVVDVFSGSKYTDADRVRPFFPSTSANYNNSRNEMGTVGTILDDDSLMEGLRSSEPLVTSRTIQHGSFSEVIVDDLPLRGRFLELYNRVMEASLSEEPLAIPLSLAEALKVRTITKGPPLLGFALKPLQKFLWGTLSQHPVFRFTGETVSVDRLQDVIGKLRPGEKWLSADYSDATNSLYSWASDIVAEELALQLELPEIEAALLLRGLTGHQMEITIKKQTIRKSQRRGQLMGSVVSFPVLCIVNAALCWAAYEIERKQKLSLRSLPLCVNGDDAVLRGTRTLHESWSKMAEFVGMKPSVGKVYYSSSYLNINSTSYSYHPDGYEWYRVVRPDGVPAWRPRCLELIPYVNMGLLYGMTRSGGQAGADSVGARFGDLGVRAHALLDSCPDDLRLTVYKAYLSRNKKILSSLRIPWFTPTHLGGLGLPILDKFTPSDLDLRVARKIYDHPDLFQLPQSADFTTWLTYKFALRRLKDFPLSQMAIHALHGVAGGSLSSLTSTLCIEALFLQPSEELAPILSFKEWGDPALILRRYPLLRKHWNDPSALEGDAKGGTELRMILAMKAAKLAYLNTLRDLNARAIKDKTIPLPEPFNVAHFPTRPLSISSLKGAYTLALDAPFGAESRWVSL
jgi:hypothetical protein